MRLISSLVNGDICRLSLLKRIEHTTLPSLLSPVVVVPFALFLIILWYYFLLNNRRFSAWFLCVRYLGNRSFSFVWFLLLIGYSLWHLIDLLCLFICLFICFFICLLIIGLLVVVEYCLICTYWLFWLSSDPRPYHLAVRDFRSIGSSIGGHSLRQTRTSPRTLSPPSLRLRNVICLGKELILLNGDRRDSVLLLRRNVVILCLTLEVELHLLIFFFDRSDLRCVLGP